MQEYERAVIFRLGRLLSGGAKGPGKKLSRASIVSKWNGIRLIINAIYVVEQKYIAACSMVALQK